MVRGDPLSELRAVIERGKPIDELSMRRLALRATARIPDKTTAADLHSQLVDALYHLTIVAELTSDDKMVLGFAQRDAHLVADRIAEVIPPPN